jgi:hypothetical protein
MIQQSGIELPFEIPKPAGIGGQTRGHGNVAPSELVPQAGVPAMRKSATLIRSC